MDDINVITGNDFPEIMVTLGILVSPPLGLLQLPCKSLGIDIAHRENSTGHTKMGITNSTTTEESTGQFIRRSGLPIQTQHAARNNGNSCERSQATDGPSTGDIVTG
jgi:hypothetical protein